MIRDMTAVVAAATSSRGIGCQNQMPWRLPGDLKHFQSVTTGSGRNAVIMGRKTWESLPPRFRPLPNRINLVLSQTMESTDDCKVAKSFQDAVDQLKEAQEIFVIGGGQVYQQAVAEGWVNRIIYTQVDFEENPEKPLDAFFPDLPGHSWTCQAFNADQENSTHVDSKSGLSYKFLEYMRIPNPEEDQYLNLCRSILENGVQRGDRTGTGTLSQFGTQMRFSLRDDSLPLLTTKRTFWRGVAEELLWFISGNTNALDLAQKDIHIWDGNGSREFLDARGLGHREVGDLGPVYGFQWRHFGADYVDMHHDYSNQGVDQLAECIDKIKNNPEDRRIIMSAWNPADLGKMALPPCHMFCQFYVDTEKNELSCQMYQRSADMGLGVPFNIASYALLTRLVAQVTGRKPGDFIHTIGDAHIYLNHVEALKEQLKRPPRPFPKLVINPDKTDIDSFEFSDFEVVGYHPHKSIKMKMAV